MPDVRMPDGTIIRNVPDGTTKEELQRRYSAHKPTSFWQGLAEGMQKPATNALRALEYLNPIAGAARNATQIANAVSGQQAQSPVAATAQAIDRQAEVAKVRSPYRGSTAGRLFGGIIGTAPTAFIPGGPVVQGMAAGALMNEDGTAGGLLRDATIGGVTGKAGQLGGKYALAPVAERIGRTRPARLAGAKAIAAFNAVTGRNAEQLPLPRPAPGDRMVNKMAPELADVRQTMADAQRLGLPISLADTHPNLRALAGSVTRFSPDARKLAEANYGPRALGQADRAVNAIDRHLAPITNIKQRATEIIDSGKPVYGPLYDQAYTAPPIASPRLEQVLGTPAGREATARANTIAANEFRDPKAMGFVLDNEGRMVLDPAAVERGSLMPQRERGYTTQSLDYVKRGIDDILEPQRNQITGKLQLDEGGRAINGVKQALVQEVDQLNPDYRAARDAYAGYAKRAEALNTGHDVLPQTGLPQRDFEAILARSTEDTHPEYQRGYATAMADEVAKRRLSANPYESIYGSPLQQQKVGALFPQGADDFGKIYGLEKEMAATKAETLGGSQTQPRNIADQQFQGGLPSQLIDGAVQLGTSGGLSGVTGLVRAVSRKIGDRGKLGLFDAEKKAAEMAPRLLDTENPQAVVDYLDKLARDKMEMEARRRAYARAGELLALPAAGIGVLGSR